MSRDYIDDPNEDAAWTLRRIADSLDAIRDVLEEWRRPTTVVKIPPEFSEEQVAAWREAMGRQKDPPP